jgi:hypothetical protein
VTPHRGNLTLAIAKVKEHMGLMLSKTEQSALDKWATGAKTASDEGELVEVGTMGEEE